MLGASRNGEMALPPVFRHVTTVCSAANSRTSVSCWRLGAAAAASDLTRLGSALELRSCSACVCFDQYIRTWGNMTHSHRPLDAVAEGASAAALNSSSSAFTPSDALQVSNLHRHLRTNNYSMVREQLLPSNDQRANHTLLVANRIGWSALHFAAASHGSLVLRERQRARARAAAVNTIGAATNVNVAAAVQGETVAEEAVDVGVGNHNNNHGHAHAAVGHHLLHHHMANQPVPLDQFGFAIPQNDANNDQEQNGNSAEEEEQDRPEGGWWRWLLLQIAGAVERSSSSSTSSVLVGLRVSPFQARTEAGMTPMDLFFCGHVRPLPWQRPEIHEAARWLRRDMANVCGDNGLISIDNSSRLQHRLRQRIEQERRVEWHRQRKERGESCDDGVDQFEQENVPWDDSILDALVVFWHAMELLLMAAYHETMDLDKIHSNDDSDDFGVSGNNCKKWRVVHALAYTGCPPEVARLAVCLYPEQVRQRDQNGDLPLHIAVRSGSSSSQWDAVEDDAHAVADIESLAGNDGDDRGVDPITGRVVRQSTLSYTPECPPVIKALLDSYPHAAACADGNGRLPLNLALVSGRTWRSGIAEILGACPDALFGTRDTATHLAPFMLAAVDQRELREHSQQTTDGDVEYEEPDEAELRAKKIASNQIGGMWRFMSYETKEKVLAKVRQDIDMIKFETIFEILRAMPDAIRTGNPHQ